MRSGHVKALQVLKRPFRVSRMVYHSTFNWSEKKNENAWNVLNLYQKCIAVFYIVGGAVSEKLNRLSMSHI